MINWSISQVSRPGGLLFASLCLRGVFIFIVPGIKEEEGDDEWSSFGPDCYLESLGHIYLSHSPLCASVCEEVLVGQ